MKTKIFLIFAMMLIWQNVIAYDFSAVAPSGQTMYYNIVNGKAELTHPGYSWQNFTKPTGDLIIPENVVHNGVVYEVTKIGQSALDGCSGLTSVTIPRTVTSIFYNSFWSCTGLTSVAFNADSCNVLGGGPTYYSPFNATSLTTMTFGNNVKVIPFCLCKNKTSLTTIIIPDSVRTICGSAFEGCSGLSSISIGKAVSYIGDNAFKNCSNLTSVAFNADSCTYAGSTYYSSSESTCPYVVFKNCPNITSFNFGNNVKVIPENLCYGLTGLASITIPRAVTSIGEHAFYGCSGLVSVTFNADSCGPLGTIVPKLAFVNCPNLTSITFGNNVKVIPNNLCMNLSSLTSVNIPDSVISIGAYAFQNCSGMTSVTIGNGVTVISNYAFSGCSGLSSVTIPNSVTTLGATSFHNCTGLTSVTFNADSCTSTATQSSFRYCPNIISFTFGNNVKVIPPYLCCQLSNLTSITCNAVIPPTVANAFSFSGVPRNIPLRVPIASVSSYQSAPVWNEFTNCIGIGYTITATVTATISEIESTSAHADIAMGQHTSYFYYFYGPQSAFTQNGLTTDEAIINYVNQYFGASERNYNDVSEYMSGLTPSTEYLLVVVPYNSNEEVGTVCREQFTTLSSAGTATVTATISEIESTSAHADIVMGQNTSYFYYFYGPQSAFTQNGLTTDEAIINYVNQNYGASERNYSNVSGYMNGLTPSTDYLLVVVPYNSNNEVGTVYREQFTTLSSAGTATVTATISEIESTSAHADIVMGQNTSYFYYFYGPQSAITQNGLTTDEAIISYVNQNYGASERNYSNVSGYMNGLTPNTAYLLVVVPYNSNDEVGTITRKQFTTLNTNGIEDASEETVAIGCKDRRLTVGGAEGEMVSVYSIDGRRVCSLRATETTVIDVPTAGVYLVKVGDTLARKVVVIR